MVNGKEIIIEDAKETAKKVRKALKAKFPETKFSVTSEYGGYTSSVNVEYVSGKEVDRIDVRPLLKKFDPKQFDPVHEIHEIVGYEYDGKLYHGADFIRI